MHFSLYFAIFLIFYRTTYGTLDISRYSEGRCLRNLQPALLDPFWIKDTFSQQSYIIMGSVLFYNTLSQFLRQKNLDSLEEAENSSCLHAIGDITARSISGFGVGPLTISCNSSLMNAKSFKIVNCTPVILTTDKTRKSSDFYFPKRVMVTWTNYVDTLFMVHCLYNNQRSWAAISTTPNILDGTNQAIISHAKALGFSLDKVIHPKFDKCNFKGFVVAAAPAAANKTEEPVTELVEEEGEEEEEEEDVTEGTGTVTPTPTPTVTESETVQDDTEDDGDGEGDGDGDDEQTDVVE